MGTIYNHRRWGGALGRGEGGRGQLREAAHSSRQVDRVFVSDLPPLAENKRLGLVSVMVIFDGFSGDCRLGVGQHPPEKQSTGLNNVVVWRRATTGLRETTLPSSNSHLSGYGYGWPRVMSPRPSKGFREPVMALQLIYKNGIPKAVELPNYVCTQLVE